MSIEYERCSSRAHVPKRAYQASAGYDLLSAERKILKPWSKEIVVRKNLFWILHFLMGIMENSVSFWFSI